MYSNLSKLLIFIFLLTISCSEDNSEIDNQARRIAETNVLGSGTYDSLKIILTDYKEDTNKVKILNELSNLCTYRDNKVNEALTYSNEALSISKKLDYYSGEAWANALIGQAHWRASKELDLSNKFNYKALQQFKKIGNFRGIAAAKLNIANVQRAKGKVDEAIFLYNEIIEYAKKNDVYTIYQGAATNLLFCYTRKGDHEKVKYVCSLGIDMAIKANRSESVAWWHSKYGECCNSEWDVVCALKHFDKATHIYHGLKDTLNLVTSKMNTSTIYDCINDKGAMIKLIEEAITLADSCVQMPREDKIRYYTWMSVALQRADSLVRAVEYIRRSLDLANSYIEELQKDTIESPGASILANVYLSKINTYGNYSLVFAKQKQYQRAIHNAYLSQELCKTTNMSNNNLFFWANYEMGSALYHYALAKEGLDSNYVERSDTVLNLQDYNIPRSFSAQIDQSIHYLNLAGDQLTSEDPISYVDYDLEKFRLKILAEAYELKGDYKNSLSTTKEYMIVQDAIFSRDNQMTILQTSMEKDFEKKKELAKSQQKLKDEKNEKLMNDKENNQKMLLSGTGVAILLLLITLRTSRKNKQQRKREQALRVQSEQSEAFKQQFLANMSHEIRTPMNAVMGMTNLVLDTALNPKQKDYMEGIKKSSNNLLHIINDILDLSKIEAGKMELEEIDFSLSDTIVQVKQILRHRAGEKGLELVTRIKSDVSDVVLGDPVRLNQVLINLTGNAIKFTEKGSVAIQVSKVTEGIRFAIVDTGIGIPADKLKRVFENFSQANSSDARKYGGTGLGLSISRQLVELMGGNISIESEEGMGTTFTFIVDFKEGSEKQLEHRIALERSIDGTILDGLKILITDDNEYNRIVARDTLKSMAHVEIFEAENGAQAIEMLKEHDFDVILMDVQMPIMNGFEATANIRSNIDAPKKDIPIIALTASVLRTDLDKCTKAGMNSYIPKPFKPQELIVGIAQVLNIELRAATKEEKKESNAKEKMINRDKVTDMTYLTDFCKGDKNKMAKYISMFTSTAPILMDKIKMAVKEGDFDTIANQVHGFKTKWIMMGMTETKDLASELERLCREDPQHEQIQENLESLMTNIKISINELNNY